MSFKELTDIDWEVIQWRSCGFTAKEISELMKCSTSTIKNRLSQIYEKLGVRNSIEMLRKLNENGIDVWSMSHECSK